MAKIVEKQGHEVTLLEVVSDHMNEKEYDSGGLAVSYRKELVQIDSRGLLCPLETNFWAIGSSDMFVLGRLFHIEETRPVTIDDAEAAIVAASRFDSGIDARVQKFYLNS